ncbi:response regulator [Limnohabitans sp. yimb22184]|uniref:response regulator n=1 Tax=Limnohabitans sp. YIMB22184 TaxID=3374104 RepID=UPI003A8A3431
MVQMGADEPQSLPQCVALVDDEEQITQALQTLLSFQGVSTSVHHSAESLLQSLQVRNGQLCLQLADGTAAALQAVVLDLNLPGMNGIDLVLTLRRLQPQLRMVMITAALEGALQARATDMQGVKVLAKPFGLESLEAALFDN